MLRFRVALSLLLIVAAIGAGAFAWIGAICVASGDPAVPFPAIPTVGTGYWWMPCALAATGALLLYRAGSQQRRPQGLLVMKLARRERRARRLHDRLLQGTQGLVLQFQAAADCLADDDPVRKRLEAALKTADRLIVEGRDGLPIVAPRDHDQTRKNRRFP